VERVRQRCSLHALKGTMEVMLLSTELC
jgi:hypothetical protein